MSEMNIEDLDFRHLQLLDSLIRHRSVTAAANELDLAQPTASHSLNRLRRVFDDPLLVRARSGMEPTPRALAMAPTIERLLELKRELADTGHDFAPGRLEREFVIAGSDVGQLIVLTSLYDVACNEAPGVRFRALTLGGEEMAAALQTGHVDLAFGAYPQLLSGINEQTLYDERYYCFAPPDHAFSRQPDIATFMASDHVLVSTRGLAHAHREVERELTGRLPAERIRMITGSFMVALVAAARSGLILTAPAQVIGHEATLFGLVRSEPPFAVAGFEVRQYWHARCHVEPAHRWLRTTLRRGIMGRIDRAN
jgi:DNA-binding transcriptional LysR family regulator